MFNARTFDGERLKIDMPWEWLERIPQHRTHSPRPSATPCNPTHPHNPGEPATHANH